MSDDNDPSGKWLTSLIEDGLPQLLIGKAASRALSRLIGAFSDIPAASLEAITQRIRDQQTARTKVTTAIADAAASRLAENEALVARAGSSWLSRELRGQFNREDVALRSVAYLSADPPKEGTPDVSEEFLSRFERLATDASSDSAREIFAKTLAGEIRKPGSFSLMALNIINLMDQKLATAIEDAGPWFNAMGYIPKKFPFNVADRADTLIRLGDFRIVRTEPLPLLFPNTSSPEPITFTHGTIGFQVFNEGHRDLLYENWILSPAGAEVMRLSTKPLLEQDIAALAYAYKVEGARKVRIIDVVRNGQDVKFMNPRKPPEYFPERDGFGRVGRGIY